MIDITALSDYMYCPRKLFLKRLLKNTIISKQSSLLHLIKRSAMQSINNKEQSLVSSITHKIVLNDLVSKYKEHNSNILKAEIIRHNALLQKQGIAIKQAFEKLWPFFSRDAVLRAYNLNAYLQQGYLSEELWQNLVPKIKGLYYLESESLGLFAVLDYVKIYPDKIVPLKIFNSKPPKDGLWPNHYILMAGFIMLINESFGTSIEKAQALYSTTDSLRGIIMNEYLYDDIKAKVNEIKSILSSEKIPNRTKQDKKCSSCWLKKYCFDDEFIEKALNEKFK